MKQFKLLLASAALLLSTGMQAQTDVTGTYLTNADFEGTYSSVYTINTNRFVFQPDGWTVDYHNESTWNMTVVSSNDNMASNFTGTYEVPADNQKYMVRFRDNKTSEYVDLFQTITIQKTGQYTFSADMIRENGSQINVELYVRNSSENIGSVSNSTANTWENRTFTVNLTAGAEVVVGIKFTNKGASGVKAGADNVKISFVDPWASCSFLTPSEDLLVNGSFDEENQGWTLSNMGYQKNGERPTRYVEKWDRNPLTGSGYARQTVANLPAGAYILKGTVNTNKEENGGTQLKVNDDAIPVSGSWTEYEIIYNLEANGNVTVSFDYSNLASNWIAIDGFSLVYGGPYDKYMEDKETYGHRLAWQNALDAAQEAIDDETYQNVTGQERTNLAALISNNQTEPTTAQGYDDAAADLVAATTAFTNAAPAYDAYVAVQTLALAAYGTLDYASSDAEMELGDPINLTPPSASEAQNMTTYLSQKLRAYYESHAMGDSENATDMTYLINNEKAEDGNNSWSWTGSKNNPASNEPWTDSNNNSSHFYFDGGNWNGTTWTTTMSQTVNLPAGKYLLTAKVRGSENLSTYTMEIGGESVNLPHTGNQGNVFGNGWTDASVEFVSQYGGDATILVTAAAENSGQQWFSISDFRLVQLEEYTVQIATTEDYGYLQEMIDEAEALHWGFQVDEYAPYNYVELLQKLEEAKAVNPEEEHSYDYVNGLTVALSDFIYDNDNPMVTNATEVNAVYDGTFANQAAYESGSANVVLPGWTTKSGNTRLILKTIETYPAVTDADDGAALFVHPGIYTYGEQTGYTMPLNANQLYSVEAKYCAWQAGSNENFTLTIKSSNGINVASKSFGKNEAALTTAGALKPVKLFFTAPADDNYILEVEVSGNTAFTDVKISSYTLETANLTLASSGYTSWVTTFDVDFSELGVEAYIVEPEDIDLDNMKIDMTQIDNAAKGTPVIFKGEPSAPFTLTESVESVTDWKATNKLKSGADCGGKIDGDNYGFVWMFSKGTFKRCQNGINLNATKAYLVLDDAILPEGDINFRADFGDGEANAINGIVDAESAPKAIYNLQGQKVNTPVKGGIYIINGKKTLVK
ncbi:MAG: hypothetical protein IKH26_05180 [Bacteroidaceae bacterium]|nr:hypothetical protein [Bacteroidaceae bacterium]